MSDSQQDVDTYAAYHARAFLAYARKRRESQNVVDQRGRANEQTVLAHARAGQPFSVADITGIPHYRTCSDVITRLVKRGLIREVGRDKTRRGWPRIYQLGGKNA